MEIIISYRLLFASENWLSNVYICIKKKKKKKLANTFSSFSFFFFFSFFFVVPADDRSTKRSISLLKLVRGNEMRPFIRLKYRLPEICEPTPHIRVSEITRLSMWISILRRHIWSHTHTHIHTIGFCRRVIYIDQTVFFFFLYKKKKKCKFNQSP